MALNTATFRATGGLNDLSGLRSGQRLIIYHRGVNNPLYALGQICYCLSRAAYLPNPRPAASI